MELQIISLWDSKKYVSDSEVTCEMLPTTDTQFFTIKIRICLPVCETCVLIILKNFVGSFQDKDYQDELCWYLIQAGAPTSQGLVRIYEL